MLESLANDDDGQADITAGKSSSDAETTAWKLSSSIVAIHIATTQNATAQGMLPCNSSTVCYSRIGPGPTT